MKKSKYHEITHRLKDGVALLTIERPEKLNSMRTETLLELRQSIMEADADDATKVIILTGSGRKAFSVGFAILDVPELSITESRQLHIRNLEFNKALMGIGKPIIAAVNGLALGAGFEISLLCDLTVATESATFGMPELAIGAYPGTVAPTLLWHFIGVKKAKELLLTCRRISAQEAASLGLVNEVVPSDKLIERAFQLAQNIMEMAPIPLTMFKSKINSMLRVLLEDEMSRFVEVQTLVFDTLDFREGLAAFKEKRKPIFCGR